MFLQNAKQFEGLIGLFQNNKVIFGIIKRDVRAGVKLGVDDFDFIDVDELQNRSTQQSLPKSIEELKLYSAS